jgi:hypothetical protein
MTISAQHPPLQWQSDAKGFTHQAQTGTFRFELHRSYNLMAKLPWSLSIYLIGSPMQVRFGRYRFCQNAQKAAQAFVNQHGVRPAERTLNLDPYHAWFLTDAHQLTIFKRFATYRDGLDALREELTGRQIHYLATKLAHGWFWWQPDRSRPGECLLHSSAIEQLARARQRRENPAPTL